MSGVPNTDDARRFLDALDPVGSSFTFQTFPDAKEGRTSDDLKRLTRVLHGSFADHSEALANLNGVGAGVFVTVNETNLKGRSGKDVVHVRALFVDLDGAPLEPIVRGPLPPSIVVRSSDGKFHCYWRCHDISLCEFSAWQKLLARTFGGDPTVCDLPRVLRMPGFLHQKGEPVLSSLIECEPSRTYSRAQFIDAFGDPAKRTAERPTSEQIVSYELTKGLETYQATAVELAARSAKRVTANRSLGRHRQCVALGYDCRRARLPEEGAKLAAETFFNLAPSTNSDNEIDPLQRGEVELAVMNAYKEKAEVRQAQRLSDLILTQPQLATYPIEARRLIVEPFITEGSLIMIYAATGVGKTWLSLELSRSIASGRSFLRWPVTEARKVLFVDGEMPLVTLKERLAALAGSEKFNRLSFLSSERMILEDRLISLHKPEDQDRFMQALEDREAMGERPDVIVFDNLSSLARGVDENSNSDLDKLLEFLTQLRHRGYAVIVVHHAGKNGTQRGASRRTDFLDYVIKLEGVEPAVRGARRGACFRLTFEKCRGMTPEPDALTLELIANDRGGLTWAIGTPSAMRASHKLLLEIYRSQPIMQKQLATAMSMSEARVSELMKELEKEGLATRSKSGVQTTKTGSKVARDYGADELPI